MRPRFLYPLAMNDYQKCLVSVSVVLAFAVTSNSFALDIRLIIPLLLFLPLADRAWLEEHFKTIVIADNYFQFSFVLLFILFIISFITDGLEIYLRSLLFASLPEEWYFRAYLLSRFGHGLKANIITSILFSLLHTATRGYIVGLMVFLPSLFFGWIFQHFKSLSLAVTFHTIANVCYILYIQDYVNSFFH